MDPWMHSWHLWTNRRLRSLPNPRLSEEYEKSTSIPTVAVLTSELRRMTNALDTVPVDVFTTCNKSTANNFCWLSENTSIFNSLLLHINLELKEHRPHAFGLYNMDISIGMDDCGVLLACLAMHLLLRIHHCIESIELSKNVLVHAYTKIICDGISLSRGLRNMHICIDLDLNAFVNMRIQLLKALCLCNSKFETLHFFQLNVPSNLQMQFVQMLQRQPLKSLDIISSDLSENSVVELMNVLCEKKELVSLKYNSNILNKVSADKFGKFLISEHCQLREILFIKVEETHLNDMISIFRNIGNNRTIKKLGVLFCDLDTSAHLTLIKSLFNNESIVTLTFGDMEISRSVFKQIAKLLKINRFLEVLEINCMFLNLSSAISLSESLKRNKSLRRLGFGFTSIEADGIVCMIETLTTNKTLNKLSFNIDPMTESIQRALCDAQAYSRVCLVSYETQELFAYSQYITNNINTITSVCVSSMICTDDCIAALFRSLQNAPFLKDLCVKTFSHIDLNMSAEAIPTILRNSSSLKSVNLCFNFRIEFIIPIMNGLEKSKSIKNFNMPYILQSEDTLQSLINIVNNNTVLNKFSSIMVADACPDIGHLLDAIENNTTLLKMDVFGIGLTHVDSFDSVFRIREAMRRNLSLRNRVMEFLMDPPAFVTYDAVVLYEKIRYSDSFVKFANKIITNNSFSHMQNRANNYLMYNFFKLANICIKIVCYSLLESRVVQIDSLNHDCLFKIISYLKLSDIKKC